MCGVKKHNVVVCVIFLLFGFSGCLRNANVLSVRSADYNMTELKAADLKEQRFVEPYGEDPFDGFYCWVSKSHWYMNQPEQLIVENSRREDSMIRQCMGPNGYFVGFDYQDFASGISFFSYSGLQMKEGDSLPTGRCVALLESGDSAFCYAVTSWNYFDEEEESDIVVLWRLYFPQEETEQQYKVEKVCNIVAKESAIEAVLLSTGEILVATDIAMYKVNSEGSVTKIAVPEQWWDLRVNSMVAIEKNVYIGTKYGVLFYQPQTDQFTWYPVDYSEIVVKKG